MHCLIFSNYLFRAGCVPNYFCTIKFCKYLKIISNTNYRITLDASNIFHRFSVVRGLRCFYKKEMYTNMGDPILRKAAIHLFLWRTTEKYWIFQWILDTRRVTETEISIQRVGNGNCQHNCHRYRQSQVLATPWK